MTKLSFEKAQFALVQRLIRRVVISTLVIVLLISSMAIPNTAVDAQQPASPTGKGANYMKGYGISYDYNLYETKPALMDDDMRVCERAGINWLRVELPVWPNKYYSNNPDSGFPTVANLRKCLSLMKKHGMSPLLNLLQWHYPVDDATMRCRYKEWLSTVVTRLGSDVSYYEVGNEENLSVTQETSDPDAHPYAWDIPQVDNQSNPPCPTDNPPWWPRYTGGVRSYVAFLKDSYDAIKHANPNATVILGGIASWHCLCYVKQLTVFKAYNFADGIGWHAYPHDTPPTPADGINSLQYLKAEMQHWPACKANMPIWITEFGFNTKKQGNTEQTKATNIPIEYEGLRAIGITTPLFVYTARDWPLTPSQWQINGPNGAGLFERGDPYLSPAQPPTLPLQTIPPPQLLPAYWTYKNLTN